MLARYVYRSRTVKPLVNHVYCCKMGMLLPTYDDMTTTLKNSELLMVNADTYILILESYKIVTPPFYSESAVYRTKIKVLTGEHKGKVICTALSRPSFLNKRLMKCIGEFNG